MVKLDSIFKALGVETENDVRLLAQYFVNHRQYKELIKNKSYIKKTNEELLLQQATDNSSAPQRSDVIDEETSATLTNLLDNDEPTSSNLTVPTDTIKLIHPNEVLTALKTFVSIHHKTDR